MKKNKNKKGKILEKKLKNVPKIQLFECNSRSKLEKYFRESINISDKDRLKAICLEKADKINLDSNDLFILEDYIDKYENEVLTETIVSKVVIKKSIPEIPLNKFDERILKSSKRLAKKI